MACRTAPEARKPLHPSTSDDFALHRPLLYDSLPTPFNSGASAAPYHRQWEIASRAKAKLTLNLMISCHGGEIESQRQKSRNQLPIPATERAFVVSDVGHGGDN